MKILILGGTGNIGSEILKQLNSHYRQFSNEICVATRSSKKASKNVAYLCIKEYSFENLKELVETFRPNTVINLAVSYGSRYEQEKINVKLPEFLGALSGFYNFDIVHFSSIAVIIDKNGDYKATKSKGEIILSKFDRVKIFRVSAQRSKLSAYFLTLKIIKIFPSFFWCLLPHKIRSVQLQGPCNISVTCSIVLRHIFGIEKIPGKISDLIGGNWFYVFNTKVKHRLSMEELRQYIAAEYNFDHLNLVDYNSNVNNYSLF